MNTSTWERRIILIARKLLRTTLALVLWGTKNVNIAVTQQTARQEQEQDTSVYFYGHITCHIVLLQLIRTPTFMQKQKLAFIKSKRNRKLIGNTKGVNPRFEVSTEVNIWIMT
jgi:hypothetical protein